MLVAVLLVTGLLLVACGGGGGGASGGQTIEVILDDYEFRPQDLQLKKGEPVTLLVKNAGVVAHDLLIPDLNQGTPAIAAGESYELKFTPQQTGQFTIECHEPGHKDLGMVGTLTVTD